MTEPVFVSVELARAIGPALRQELLTSFPGDLQDRVGALPDWADYLVILGGLGSAVEVARAITDTAAAIVRWRKKCRDAGTEPAAVLRSDAGVSIDLAKASDDEVIAWVRETYRDKSA